MAGPGEDSIGAVAADFWEWQLRENPEDATALGDHRFDDRLTDLSAEAYARRGEAARELSRRLDALGALTGENAITADVLRLQLAETVDAERLHLEQIALNQIDGPQVSFPRQIARHPSRDNRDVAFLLRRYLAFPSQMKDYLINLGAGLAARRAAPRIVVERVMAQLRDRLAQDPLSSVFVKGRPPEHEFAIATAVAQNVYPAYQALLDFLEHEYLPRSRANIGLWALPGGEEIYAFAIRQRTTTGKTPAELHELGEVELARIEAELRALVGQPVRRTLEQWVEADPHFEDRAAQLHAYRTTAERFRGRLPEEFGTLPLIPLRIEPMPDFLEQHAPGAIYERPSSDGERPGTCYVNTCQPETQPRYRMEPLVAHEALPGHHLQISLALGLTDLPAARRRARVTAFSEGWGMYAERLADEMGLYSDDRARLGMLLGQAFRAARLVVDTGIHAMKWTREHAIEYLLEHSVATRREAELEIDRYIVWPAQGMSYMVGQMEILAARAEAQQLMGARFSRRAFHDRLLASGAMPLHTMRRVIAEWARAAAGVPQS